MATPFSPRFPTPEHQAAADVVVGCLAGHSGVRALLLTCSCATGQAVPESCVDIAVLLADNISRDVQIELTQMVVGNCECQEVNKALQQHGPYAEIDLDFFRMAQLDPKKYYHGWCSGPDMFEVEIGNYLAYSHVLWEIAGAVQESKEKFLPYYSDALRGERLAEVSKFCRNNLDHVPFFVRRGLYFQAHRRLLNALGEYLQALFISRRVYPICYDKWIRFQLEKLLGEAEIYRSLVELTEIHVLESDELCLKAERLAELLDKALSN